MSAHDIEMYEAGQRDALLGLAATCGVIYLLWQAGLYLAKLNAA